MSFLTQGKTNWKYILIVVILAAIVGGGIFGYCRWLKQKVSFLEFPEIKRPEKAEGDIEKYLHKDAILRGVDMPPEAEYQAIPTKEAILIVAQNLENQNVKDIKIRHLLWSVAPRGEFFIAGDCGFTQEGEQYNKFLAVIEDGSEGEVGKPSLIFKDTDIWYSNLAPSALPEELVGRYESLAEIYNVTPIFKSSEIKDETANWKTYRFSIQKLKEIEGLTQEKQREVEKKIVERRLENCSFEIKYPPDWTAYTWPLHGVIVPEGLFIEEDSETHKGCIFQMSFYGDPEKEKYCFPTSLSSGESNPEECNKIFNQMLSTFRFLE